MTMKWSPGCLCCGGGPCPVCGSVDWEWTEYAHGIDVTISGLVDCLTLIDGAADQCSGIQWTQLNGTYTYRVYSTGPVVSQVSDGYATIANQAYIDIEVDYVEAGEATVQRVYRMEFAIDGTAWSFDLYDRGVGGLDTPTLLYGHSNPEAATDTAVHDFDCSTAGTCFAETNEATFAWDVCGSPWQACGTTLDWRLITNECTGTCLPVYPVDDGVTAGDDVTTCCAERPVPPGPLVGCCNGSSDVYNNCQFAADDAVSGVEFRLISDDSVYAYQTGASWRNPDDDCTFYFLMYFTADASTGLHRLRTPGLVSTFFSIYNLTTTLFKSDDSLTPGVCYGTDVPASQYPTSLTTYAVVTFGGDDCYSDPFCIGECELESDVTTVSSMSVTCTTGPKAGQTFTQTGTATLARPGADAAWFIEGSYSGAPSTTVYAQVGKRPGDKSWVVFEPLFTATNFLAWMDDDICSGTISTVTNNITGGVTASFNVDAAVCPP